MNLAKIVEHRGRFLAARPAIEFDGRALTYSDLDRSIRRTAAVLRGKGIKAGDVVGLMMTETPLHIAAFLAVARLGAIVLPMDWRWTSTEFLRVADTFKPALILSDRNRPQIWQGMFVLPNELESAEQDDSPPVPLQNAPLVYSLSSGTTGRPKAMVVTHEIMYARMINIVSEFPLLRPLSCTAAVGLCGGATLHDDYALPRRQNDPGLAIGRSERACRSHQ